MEQLPDPHALVEDPNDPTGKTRYNDDNQDDGPPLGDDGIVSDDQFVEGMIVAMEEHCPDVANITEEERADMIEFVKRNKDNNLRKRWASPSEVNH